MSPHADQETQSSAASERCDLVDDDVGRLGPGTEVGPYIVVDRIGHGGMGEVFLARDPRLDRLVALKCVLSRETDSPELRNRIIFEARAAARITHLASRPCTTWSSTTAARSS